jgi:uncharacterized membrane protein (TIGR02234 family)
MQLSQRREYLQALLLGAVGAGLVLLALRQGWARAEFTPPQPLPTQDIAVTGQDLAPAAGALALAALACLAAVIATRGKVRRGVGVLLAGFGAGVAVAVSGSVQAATVLKAAASLAATSASSVSTGSTTSGSSSGSGAVVTAGSSGHAIMVGIPWRAAVVAGALAIVAGGLLTAWRGARWPVMSSRYERPASRDSGIGQGSGTAQGQPQEQEPGEGPGRAADPAAMWESLTQGDDPTLEAVNGAPGGRTAD